MWDRGCIVNRGFVERFRREKWLLPSRKMAAPNILRSNVLVIPLPLSRCDRKRSHSIVLEIFQPNSPCRFDIGQLEFISKFS